MHRILIQTFLVGLLLTSSGVFGQHQIVHDWSAQILCCDNNIAYDAVELPDDKGYVVAGQRFLKERETEYVSELALVSKNGKLIKSIHTAIRYNARFERVLLTASGRLLLVGSNKAQKYSGEVLTLVEYDYQLKELGKYQVESVLVSSSEPPEIVETKDGFAVVNSYRGGINITELDKNFKFMEQYEVKDTAFRLYDFELKSIWYLSDGNKIGFTGLCCNSASSKPCSEARYSFIFYYDLSTNFLRQSQVFTPGLLISGSSVKNDTVFLSGTYQWMELDYVHGKALFMAVTTSGKELWRREYDNLRRDWFSDIVAIGDSVYLIGGSWKPGDKRLLAMTYDYESKQFISFMDNTGNKPLNRPEYYKIVAVKNGFLALGNEEGSWLISRFVLD